MRAWHSSLILIVVACGGTTDVGDGGDNDTGTGVDVVTTNDTGTGNDTGTTVDASDDGTTNDTGTTVDAGAFDPSQLGTNLILWLDAAKGVTTDPNNNNGVKTWADQTSYHNDASGNSGQFPHEPAVNATALNNLPALVFANTGQGSQYLQITDSASMELGAGDFAIFMVAEYANPTSNTQNPQATFFAKIAGNTTPTGPQLYGTACTGQTCTSSIRARININDNVNSAATGFNDSKFHRIGIRRTGSTLEVWADGVSTSFTPDAGGAIDVSATGSDAYIGAQFAGTNFPSVRLQGGIAEVIGVKGTLSSGDVTALDGYFKSKYAL